MDDMLEDVLEMDDDEELEEEADAEVDKVLFELTDGKLGQAGSVQTELPVSVPSFEVGGLHADVGVARSQRKTQSTRRRPREKWRSIGSS